MSKLHFSRVLGKSIRASGPFPSKDLVCEKIHLEFRWGGGVRSSQSLQAPYQVNPNCALIAPMGVSTLGGRGATEDANDHPVDSGKGASPCWAGGTREALCGGCLALLNTRGIKLVPTHPESGAGSITVGNVRPLA